MASNRENRFLMRQRGAGTHQIKDADFGLAFPIPSKLQLAPRLSSSSSISARRSLPGGPSQTPRQSVQVTPLQATLRRQQSESALVDRSTASAVTQRSKGKRSNTSRGKRPVSTAASGSSAKGRSLPQYLTPSKGHGETNVAYGEASEDEEDMGYNAAETPSTKLKRKRDTSPYYVVPKSTSRRSSGNPRGTMVDELERSGLFMSSGGGREELQMEEPDSDILDPGTAYEGGHEPAGLEDNRTYNSVQSVSRPGEASADQSDAGGSNEEQVDELAGEADAAEENDGDGEESRVSITVPVRHGQLESAPREQPEGHSPSGSRSRPVPSERMKISNQRSSAPKNGSSHSQNRNQTLRQQAARNIRRSKGAQVLVYRLANTRAESSGPGGDEEDDEDVLHTAPKFIRRPGVNAVDVLNQLCKELVEVQIQDLQDRAGDEPDAVRRGELRRSRKAVEAFGQELEERCFELTEALDNNYALAMRVRQANKEKLTLREELLRIRREREALALKIDDIKRLQDQRAAVTQHQNEINSTMHDIELAVQRGRAKQQQRADHPRRAAAAKEEEEMFDIGAIELQLRKFAHVAADPAPHRNHNHNGRHDDSDEGGGGHSGGSGLLWKVKDFNNFLERVVAVLEDQGHGMDGG